MAGIRPANGDSEYPVLARELPVSKAFNEDFEGHVCHRIWVVAA